MSPLIMAAGRSLAAALVAVAAYGAVPAMAAERPICQMADSLVGAVDMHLNEWDNQIDIGLNDTMNCSMFLEFVYLSRDRIRTELDYVRGNFSAEDEMFKARGEEGVSTTWAMSHMSKAASLVSAHVHIHGVLAAARRECLNEHLQLLFLMSLRRLKDLLHNQYRQIWIVFQGTADLFRQGSGKWLADVVELFEADLRTMESIMVSWQPPEFEIQGLPPPSAAELAIPKENATRPGPPLPVYSMREPDGVSLSTLEVLRRDTFTEWDTWKPLLRGLLRYVLPRDGHIADFCAGNGQAADFLNNTGLVTAYAFDPSPNIRLLSKGLVDYATLHSGPLSLWRKFDLALCLSAARDYATEADVWAKAWENIDASATRGAVLSCGDGETRRQALVAKDLHAPLWNFDSQLSSQLGTVIGEDAKNFGLCVFWRT